MINIINNVIINILNKVITNIINNVIDYRKINNYKYKYKYIRLLSKIL